MPLRWKSWFGRAASGVGTSGDSAEIDASPAPRRRPDAFGSLRIPSFRWFILGSLLSNIGNLMRTTTIGWEIYQRTGEARALGLVGLTLAAPVITLALPAGVAADRFSRRGILILSHVGLILAGLGLAWASHVQAPLPLVYALLFCTGVCRAFAWPAMVAILTQMVPANLYANAATWRSVAFQTAATLGPLIGARILAEWNAATAYLIDVATTAAFLFCVIVVRLGQQSRAAAGLSSWQSLLDGVRFVRREPLILSTITLDMVAVLFGGATALLPIYAEDVLHVGADGYGWLRAMPAVGAIVMALLLASRVSIRRAGLALLLAVAAFGIWTIVFGLSEVYELSLVAMFMIGAVDAVSVVIRSTILQLLTPDELRGRVAAVNAIFINTSNEIGEYESGYTAHWFGAVRAVVGGGVLTLATVAWVGRVWPSLWHLGRLDDIQPRGKLPEPVDPTLTPTAEATTEAVV